MTDWQTRSTALAQKEGEEWDTEAEKYKEEWITEYGCAFVEIAVSRGWKRTDAAVWPNEIGMDAFIANPSRDPRIVAVEDVAQIEQEGI